MSDSPFHAFFQTACGSDRMPYDYQCRLAESPLRKPGLTEPAMQFSELFPLLTGSSPFPWQEALYRRFIDQKAPSIADLPTGLGKTSVVAIWLAALLTHPDKVPRRLVYVVNRRTVVDQTTAEVERIRERIIGNPELANKLKAMCAVSVDVPLALSTMRGQFADNREWSLDPARPAVIVGTVDMIGSGLLFNRYTCGFKTRPHHAALLGQDVLLVHDEAHLEPAFQKLLDSIVAEQARCGDSRPLSVLQLSATARGAQETAFQISSADEENEIVSRRLNAHKKLRLVQIEDEKKLADKLTELALSRRESGRAVLIFSRTVDVVQKIADALKSQPHEVLTGTMRGKEREDLLKKPILSRFLPASARPKDAAEAQAGTCYLVATSAGEVGVNLSAQDLICDLSTYESVAQRFGRANRFGDDTETVIEVVHPEKFKDDDMDAARSRTLDLLRELNGNASPQALQGLPAEARAAAFSPAPTIRPATDILFDAWAMTSIREPLPGRPPIVRYLHGEAEWQPPETVVAWREEVEIITPDLAATYDPTELLAEFPLKPHELLRDRSSRVREHLADIVKRLEPDAGKHRVWIVAQDGNVRIKPLIEVADKDLEMLIEDATLLLPTSIGGLSDSGLMDGKSAAPDNTKLDVAEVINDNGIVRTRRFTDAQEAPEGLQHLREQLVIDTWASNEEIDDEADDSTRYWVWLEAPCSNAADSSRGKRSITLKDHTQDVVGHAQNIATKLGLDESQAKCLILAAKLHDLGKKRFLWQRGIGNHDKSVWLAKAGPNLRARSGHEPYRHEFGSVLDAESETEFKELPPDEQDLVLHLVAAHHGRARPHFPADEATDPDAEFSDASRIAAEVPQRYARLQRKYGRWGLAYLESLLRAADYAASAEIKPLNAESNDRQES